MDLSSPKVSVLNELKKDTPKLSIEGNVFGE